MSLTVAVGMCAAIAGAQEPALRLGRSAVRFQEAPGLFHYITPCEESKPESGGEAPPALCWPVHAAYVQRVDGKIVQSATVAGVVRVSASEVRFLPDVPTASIPTTVFPVSAVTFGHKASATEARFGNNDGVYLFAFEGVCSGCTKDAASPDPAKTAQLDAEFELFHEALTTFSPVYERLHELSLQLRVKIAPGAEPVAAAKPAVMGLYAGLNTKLAAACTEPDKSCVLKYASYQACKAGATATDCGAPPECTAEAVLPKDFDKKGLAVVVPKVGDAAQLRPEGVGAESFGPVKLSGGIIVGQLLERVNPVYPMEAKQRHLNGTVVLRALITKEGSIMSLTVVSTTSSIFNDAALDAVKKWRYKPYLLNGEPVEVDTIISVNFSISGGPGAPPGFGPQGGMRPAPMPGMPPGGR